MAFGRLLMFRLLSHLDHIIYLDCDVRVFKPCLKDILRYHTHNSNCLLSVVRDHGIYLINNENELLTVKTDHYFNTGVCAFNIKACISYGINEKIDKILSDAEIPLKFADQTILNLIFKDDKDAICFLPEKYNSLIMLLGI